MSGKAEESLRLYLGAIPQLTGQESGSSGVVRRHPPEKGVAYVNQ